MKNLTPAEETLQSIFSQIRSSICTLHPSCFFDVAVQGENKVDFVTYVKSKQLNQLSKAADRPYSFYSPVESCLRNIETDLAIGCNDNIIPSLMEEFAWLELHMSLIAEAYADSKNNQLLWKFYTDNLSTTFKSRKQLSRVAVMLSESFCEKSCEDSSTFLWSQWKTSQVAVHESYEALCKERSNSGN